MAHSILKNEVLEEQHSAADYLEWVRSLVKQVKEEPDGLARIRLRIGPAKELINEAFPIGLLAATYFGGSNQVHLALKVGNQPYDATVSDLRPDGTSIQFIEVTLAGDGEDDYRRMHTLHECGHVSGLGRATKNGTKKTGFSVESTMVSQAEVLNRERNRIACAIRRKLTKSYPPNTLLLVAFDDTMAFDRPDNISNIQATVSEFLPTLASFHSVALVGLQKRMLLSWRTGSAT